jgi:hypothetical protein
MRLRILLVCCAALALTVGVTTATGGGGNSAAAKACQKGGWQTLYRSDGTSFANEDECVSYAAKGGTPVSGADISVSGVRFVLNNWAITVANAGPGTATVTAEGHCDSGDLTTNYGNGEEVIDQATVRWTATLASGGTNQIVMGCYGSVFPYPGTSGHFEVYSSSRPDPDSTPNNANPAEDDYLAITPQ